MSLLIPKFHPITWAVLAAAYLLCLVCGGEPNPEVTQAAWPLVALGGAWALGGGKEAMAAKRAKKDAEALAKAQAARAKGFETAMAPIVDPAEERLADPTQYKESAASRREKLEETQQALEAQTRAQEAEGERGAGAGPYGSGKQFQMMDYLRKRRADALSGAKLGIERQSDYLAAQKEAADKSLLQSYAAQQAGLASMPGPSTPGLGEGLMDVGISTIGAGAQMGVFGEATGPGGGGGSGGGGAGAGSSAYQQAGADLSNLASTDLSQPTTFSYGT